MKIDFNIARNSGVQMEYSVTLTPCNSYALPAAQAAIED